MKVPFNKISAGNIDLSDWVLPKLDDVRDGILEAFEETILAACEEEAWARLPFIWGMDEGGDDEGPVSDPLVVRIGVPLGGDDTSMPSWDVNVGDLIEEEVATWNGTWSEDDLGLLTKMRERLIGIVGTIDAQIDALKKQCSVAAAINSTAD